MHQETVLGPPNVKMLHVITTHHHPASNAVFRGHVLQTQVYAQHLIVHSLQMVLHATMAITLPKTINVMHLVIVLEYPSVKVLRAATIHHPTLNAAYRADAFPLQAYVLHLTPHLLLLAPPVLATIPPKTTNAMG